MKVVVVDDEKAVLHGLRHIFQKHCPDYEVVGMYQNAQEALRLLTETQVDVVITDVQMPGMNGIDLTREICSQYPDISVVILSGHDDYEYVRHAMKDGAFDYLLKPCHYLTVIEILQKIELRVKEKREAHHQQSRKEYLEKLLTGKDKMADSGAQHQEMMMAVITGEGSSAPYPGECIEQQIASWSFGDVEQETVVHEGKCIVIFPNGIDPAEIKQRLQAYRQHMRVQHYFMYAGIHRFPCTPDGMAMAYGVCNRMIEFMRFHELSAEMDDDMYRMKLEQQKGFAVSAYLSGRELGKYYAGADARRLRQYVETTLHQLQRIDLKPEPSRFRKELFSELVYLDYLLKEHGGAYNERQIDVAQEMQEAKTLRQLLDWLKNYLMSIVMCMNDENLNPQYILSAIRYIELNYMRDLSLKEVADAVYLNPWYFSSQFKKHVNLSFSEYLNVVRCRIAKDFLRQKDLKVYQVAEMVGFQDAAYFSTVFKSIEKMSPKEFQKTF